MSATDDEFHLRDMNHVRTFIGLDIPARTAQGDGGSFKDKNL